MSSKPSKECLTESIVKVCRVSCVDEEGLRDKSDDMSQTETGSSSDDETEEQLTGEYLVVYGHKVSVSKYY